MSTHRLAIRDLEVRYAGAAVLRNVSLTVAESEVTVLLGPNGAGKTTLLRTITGLKAPSSGQLLFEGTHLTRTKPYSRARAGLVLVPEGRQIFTRMTVMDNLMIGSWGRKVDSRYLAHLLDLFPVLGERSNQLGGLLSGGEQQMLAIARALMRRPRLLLLDEPSMGLAPIMADRVFELIQRVHAEGVGVLVVEQRARQALQIADRFYVLQHGTIALQGTPLEVAASGDLFSAYFGWEHSSEEGGTDSRRRSVPVVNRGGKTSDE